MSETRKIAAILVADVVGYSRLAGADEDRTLSRLRGLRSDLIDPPSTRTTGASSSAPGTAFSSNSAAWSTPCAAPSKCSNGLIERNAGVPAERRIEFRVGIHLGDVVEESDGDLMGDGVNIAAGSKASRSPARSVFPRTPIVRSSRGSISRSAISAQPSSRTSPSRSASIRLKSASQPRRSPRRSQRPANPPRASRWSSCRSPISAATRSRSISSTGSQRA